MHVHVPTCTCSQPRLFARLSYIWAPSLHRESTDSDTMLTCEHYYMYKYHTSHLHTHIHVHVHVHISHLSLKVSHGPCAITMYMYDCVQYFHWTQCYSFLNVLLSCHPNHFSLLPNSHLSRREVTWICVVLDVCMESVRSGVDDNSLEEWGGTRRGEERSDKEEE